MTGTNPYELFGVRRRINAAGALTRLGGGMLTLDPQVLLPEHDAPLAAALRAMLQSTVA